MTPQENPPRLRWQRIALAVGVFALAFAVRWPSTGESFWVDELHSGWSVADRFRDVSERARMGNQNPIYFQALWVWIHIPWGPLGEIYSPETLWRMSSVLATSFASAWASVLVLSVTRHLIAGAASGMVMALQSDAVFYGTELRSYSMIILLTVAAAAMAWQVTRDSQRPTAWWILLAIVGLAALLHITSIITLGALIAAIAWSRWKSLPLTSSAIAIAIFLAWQSTEVHSIWQRREDWQAFGRTNSIKEIFQQWPWVGLIVVPLSLALTTPLVRWRRPNLIEPRWFLCILAAMIVGTAVTWTLAATETAFLWHRRYSVANLPLMAICFGLLVGSIATVWKPSAFCIVAIIYIAVMTSESSSLVDLLRGDLQLVHRGEQWRTAVQWLNQQAGDGDLVWVDPGLIEQTSVDWPVENKAISEYLTFVARGPYPLRSDLVIVATNASATRNWQEKRQPNAWLLTRRRLATTVIHRRFGSVLVASPAPNKDSDTALSGQIAP